MSLNRVLLFIAFITLVFPCRAQGKFELARESVEWEQLDSRQSFFVFPEREQFENIDRAGRFVCAVQKGHPGPPLRDLAVHWKITGGGATLGEGNAPIDKGLISVSFDLASLKPGRYEIEADLLHNAKVIQNAQTFFRYVNVSSPSQSGRIAINLPRGVPLTSGTYPVQAGVPFPKGALWSEGNVRLVTANGTPLPFQTVVRSRWGHRPDSSIRWLGVDFQTERADPWWPRRKETKYFLEFGPNIKKAAPLQHLVRVRETEDGFWVNTEALRFLVRKKGFNLIDQVRLGGKEILAPSSNHGLYLIDHEGNTYRAVNDRDVKVSIEEQGPLRVVLRAEGWYVKDGTAGEKQSYTLPTEKLCKFITRIEAYAGKPYVRVLHTWINTFDTSSVRLRDMGISLPVQNATRVEFGVEGSIPLRQAVNGDGAYLVQHKHDAFNIESGKGKVIHQGKRSAGWVLAETANSVVGISHRETWQRFPKELEVLPNAVKLHIWPMHGKGHPEIKETARDQIHKLWFAHQGREMNMAMPWEYFLKTAQYYDQPTPGPMNATGHAIAGVYANGMGISITSDILLQFTSRNDEAEMRDTAACFQVAPQAIADSKWLCDSLALGRIHPYDPEKFPDLEAIGSNMLRGYWGVQNKTGIYGMFLYRPWNANRLETETTWDLYRIYNAGHRYEPYMPWLYYARSGDPFYLTQGMTNVRMLSDVQTLHYVDPKFNHVEFDTPQKRLVGAMRHDNSLAPWGGDYTVLGHPTCFGALITAHYLTGDLRLREVVVDEWQKSITTDRENRTTDLSAVSGPGRENNNAISEIIDLYQMTYHPALVVRLKPLLDDYPKWTSWGWGQVLPKLLLFRDNEQIRTKLEEQVAVTYPPGSREMPFYDYYSVASFYHPEKRYDLQAYQAANSVKEQLQAGEILRGTPGVSLSDVPDSVNYLPRLMYALHRAGARGGSAAMPAEHAQPMPVSPTDKSETSPGGLRCIVREDKDGDWKVSLFGAVFRKEFYIQVYAPDKRKIVEVKVPKGVHSAFDISVPRDGLTGQYVIYVHNPLGTGNELYLPLTNLPGEVYLNTYWEQTGATRFFTRSSSDAPESLEIVPAHSSGKLTDISGSKILASTTKGDSLRAVLGPQGMWMEMNARYVGVANPLLFSVTPGKWFSPSPDKLQLPIQPIKAP